MVLIVLVIVSVKVVKDVKVVLVVFLEFFVFNRILFFLLLLFSGKVVVEESVVFSRFFLILMDNILSFVMIILDIVGFGKFGNIISVSELCNCFIGLFIENLKGLIFKVGLLCL